MSLIWLLWLPATLAAPKIFPLVDPGLFVISGVRTCGGGGGYCLLGLDCTLDEDFLPDTESGQHCDGLKSAFTPSAHFVCCRATNKTAYKPPITFPSIGTSASTAPVTARTSTINVLENEIDNVLLKVAQSVNALKKPPVTEATIQPVDEADQTSEEDGEEEEEEGEDEMVADSPIEELWQEMSPEDDETEELGQEVVVENKGGPVLPNTDVSPSGTTVSHQTSITDDSSIEKKSEENTISPGGVVKGTVTEETLDTVEENEESVDEEIDEENATEEDIQQEDEGAKPVVQTDSPINLNSSQNGSNISNLSQNTVENNTTNNSVKEMPQYVIDKTVESHILNENPLDGENDLGNDKRDNKPPGLQSTHDKENKDDDLRPHSTAMPDLLKEVAHMDETSHVDEESQLNSGSKTVLNDSSVKQENTTPTSIDTLKTPVSVMDSKDEIEVGTKMNDSDSQLSDVLNNGTNLAVKNTTELDENQSVTSTPMFPGTPLPNNTQQTVTQVQSGTNEPCSKVSGEKCTQEVKFVINNQTLCFGSVYALDWVVTSASCALRIFRAGMLNVIISPLSESSEGHVKTIVVHESYAEHSGASGQGMEPNNIGLVQLHSPMVEWSPCVPCLPEPGAEFSGVNCSAVTSMPLSPMPPQPCDRPEDCKSARSEGGPSACEGPSRKMADDLGFSYITLNCDTLWEPRFYDPSTRGSGAPLYCGGVLAGVETGAGVGLMVYTPLTPYLPWLLKNTRPPPASSSSASSRVPEQTFNVG